MYSILNGKELKLGVCYYPEHWDRKLWAEDLERMSEAGIKVVRVAEFAWNLVEPKEDKFNFSFWDSFLDLAYQKGIEVIFGTPSATPPAWLTEKYPEALNRDKQGRVIHHGARRHYNYNSPIYRKFVKRIVTIEAEHFGQHPAIIGWQIDNEFNCEENEFYSESDTEAFRIFLHKKYGSIESLNESWGTVFWNQTYNDFSQIYVPRHTNGDTQNPHLLLDYKRFISDSVNSFALMQAEIIRKYSKPDDFVTTNGIFGNIDYQQMQKDSLDFMTYDSYPNFAYCLDDYQADDSMKDRKWSRNLSEVRAISSNFGIMEQQSGANGWYNRMEAPTPRPGQITLWTLQSIAHGADFISYFRWRTCTFGTEMYWHGILDYSGRENRRLQEIKEIYTTSLKLKELAGAKYRAKVGILKDYDNEWDADVDKWHGRIKWSSERALFEEMQLSHTPFDYVYLNGIETGHVEEQELSGYNVLFYPHPEILNVGRMQILERYVKNGGTIIFGCRTGQKDMTGKCVMEPLPGLAGKLTGADVLEYSFIAPDEGTILIKWEEETFEASTFYEMLDVQPQSNGKVLACYQNGTYAGSPALIEQEFGKGKVYYLGAGFTRGAVQTFLSKLNEREPYGQYIEVPSTVELALREKDGKRYFFLLNYLPEKVEILLHTPMWNMIAETMQSEKITLKPYEAVVLRI